MHKGHLTLINFLLLELHSLIYLEILSYSFCFLFRIINLHSQTGSSKGVWGWEGLGGGGGENPFKFTQTVLYI